jgi:hypothetical protein
MADPAQIPSKEVPARVQQRAVRRLIRNSMIVGALLTLALTVGAVGYHYTDDLPWLDAYLNASMILTGMGPVAPLIRPQAKVFAIVYAMVSGVFFLTMVAVLLGPAVQVFLHKFHLELAEDRRDQGDGLD